MNEEDHQHWVRQYITIQEPRAGKFRITTGKSTGTIWECYPYRSATVEQAKRDYLRTINKTAQHYLTQEEIDDFLKFVTTAGFRIMQETAETPAQKEAESRVKKMRGELPAVSSKKVRRPKLQETEAIPQANKEIKQVVPKRKKPQ